MLSLCGRRMSAVEASTDTARTRGPSLALSVSSCGAEICPQSASDALSYKPTHSFGLPAIFITHWQVRYYSGIAVDIHGAPIGDLYPGSNFKGVAIDPNDPPTFESQAAYLKRHGLFLPGEERRLRKADWEAEPIHQS
jgi:hypothetical protein